MLYWLRRLNWGRMVVGICMVVDGMPLNFFLRETLRLAPNSRVFTALFLATGFVLMVPFTVLRRLYRPNPVTFPMAISFLMLSMFSMYYVNGVPGFDEYNVDIFYFLFAFIFLLLLINIPNDIIEVALPVIIVFTVVSNIALVYALVTDPTWSVGQRAVINYSSTETGERSGSPHDFARNALMSIIACGSWIFRPQTGFLLRVVCLFFAVFGAAILVMTQTRSSVIALGLIIVLFLAVNARPAQIRRMLRGLFRPMSLLTMAIFIGGLSVLLRRFSDVYGILYGYAVAFIERNLENVYAALGMRSAGAAYKATLDASAANRAVSTDFFSNVIIGHLEMLILGNGYKFLYLDIPLLEAFVNHGILGLLLFGGMNAVMLWQSFRAMQTNLNPLTTFLAYFYVLVFVQLLTNGRPYEIYHWLPLGLMIRFVGLESRFPVRLWNRQPDTVYEGYAIPNNTHQHRVADGSAIVRANQGAR